MAQKSYSNITQTALCHICGANSVSELSGYSDLPRVTSDCRPWQSGGKLGLCGECQTIVNITDEKWIAESASIYETYTIYADGSEPSVFKEGTPYPRSAALFEYLRHNHLDLSREGRLLDFGCASGGLLRVFQKIAPSWSKVGFEVDEKHKKEVESIPGVESMIFGNVETIDGDFDLVTLVHVLEHLINPAGHLQSLKEKLKTGGYLFVQVPDAAQNHFELLVADHCTHFTKKTLAALIESVGLEIVALGDDWLPRELSVLARVGRTDVQPLSSSMEDDYSPSSSIDWLGRIATQVKEVLADDKFGIFGSSIAASWLFAVLEGDVAFFVDEDPNRAGKSHLGRPILRPRDVPAKSIVFIGLPYPQASLVSNRLAHFDIQVLMPVELES